MTPLSLSKADARRLLASHHFPSSDIRGVFDRFGSVQYDPLSPVGTNHDLVLQSRVPDYKVGDWKHVTYNERYLLDAWDKQASIVRMQDWPVRRIYHTWHRPPWERDILSPYPNEVRTVLDELERRGPLSSSDFEFQVRKDEWNGSWYGPRLTKHILRALWHTGQIVTSGRRNGHHVYDLAENVVPKELLTAPPVSDEESLDWVVRLRHQATALLRPTASYEVWGMHVIKSPVRKASITRLVDSGVLTPVDIDGVLYHALNQKLALLDEPFDDRQMRFIAPLDQIMWDRKAVEHLYGFDYNWEVYKPEHLRQYGYYVLPVFYGDAPVARIDSQLKVEGGTKANKASVWTVHSWRWEHGVVPDTAMLDTLSEAVARFMNYLGTDRLKLPTGLDARTRAAFYDGKRRAEV